MKYSVLIIFFLFSLSLFSQGKILQPKGTTSTAVDINWMTWEEANAANKVNPKKIFIDVYTEWCGWCKKMDKATFKDPAVIEALNKDFYAVKFDAEQKEEIMFNGATFKWTPNGRKGTHQLAYALLDGRMGFPAFVMLDEAFQRVMLSPGFKRADEMLTELSYTSTNAYKTENFKAFAKKK